MSGKQEFFELIDKGRVGGNLGLSMGLPKLELYMDGYLPGTSYLVGAPSGVGKSTFTLYTLIYRPLTDFLAGNNIARDPYWIIFPLEMTRPQIYAKLISMYIFDTFGEQITFKEIFSRGRDTMLSDNKYDLIKNCEQFLDILDERLIFIEGYLNASRYETHIKNLLTRFGTFNKDSFIPNNPDQVVGVVIDHMSLIRQSNGKTKKEEMDLISSYSIQFRNKCKIISPIHVMQFNRDAGNAERLKQALQEPTVADFKDSGAIYEDSQVVFALYNPFKFKKPNHNGYNIKELQHNYIACILLKSRFGTSDMATSLGFYGDCSYFKELPRADSIIDYSKYTNPYWIMEKEPEKDCKENNNNNNSIKLTL
jgi:replicative DNA helicase